MNDMTKPEPASGLDVMRSPFPSAYIGKLPKGTKAQNDCPADQKVNCKVCGGWHHPRVVHLDYVGHAAITQRLLDADPHWNWEPLAFNDKGLPMLDESGCLWIRLTVAGITRLGFGDAQGKHGPNAVKEAIGDAIRNAAMRFGAALELWHKGNWEVGSLPDVDPETPVPEPEQKALPLYTQKQLDSNLEAWRAAIAKGKITPERIIGMIASKYTLGAGHTNQINALTEKEAA
jgi:hypothetical protein